MKNKLIMDNKNNDTYRVILKIKTEKEEYLIYTKDEVNKYGDIVCYLGEYETFDGIQKIYPINDEETLEKMDTIFRQVLNILNKKEKKNEEKSSNN